MKKCEYIIEKRMSGKDEDRNCPFFDYYVKLSGTMLDDRIQKCKKCLSGELRDDDNSCQDDLVELMDLGDLVPIWFMEI